MEPPWFSGSLLRPQETTAAAEGKYSGSRRL
jgi:hypothetical protein